MRPTLGRAAPALVVAALMLTFGGAPGFAAAGKLDAGKVSTDPFGDLTTRQRELAQEAETEDDPLRAVAHWEYVLATNPNDAAAKAKIPALKKQAHDKAEQFFKEGFAQYERQNIGPAFKALLKGLSYDPTNQEAIRLVKQELNAKSVIDYRVEAGDTLATIAEKNKKEGYENAGLASVIARFNGLKEGEALKAGRVLQVPVLVGVLPRAPVAVAAGGRRPPARPAAPAPGEDASEYDDAQSNAQADQAADLLKANKFDDAAKLASKVLDEDPLNKQAKEVRNAANMGLGQQFLDAKKFEAALSVFSRVDPSFPNQPQQVAAARSQIVDKAELAYQEGVKYFLDDDLDNAIKAFQATLQYNPNHSQARKDMQQAIETREKLKKLQ